MILILNNNRSLKLSPHITDPDIYASIPAMCTSAAGNSSDIVSHMSESESEYSPTHIKLTALSRKLTSLQTVVDSALIVPAPPPCSVKPSVRKMGAVSARSVL